MIRTLTAAGAPPRNALPLTAGPLTAGPLTAGPLAPGARIPGQTGASAAGAGDAGYGYQEAFPVPTRVPAAALSLLRNARSGLVEAETEHDPGTRYIGAHLAALRAAAAIVAARGEPGSGARRRRPRSVWELLPQVEPTLAEWAAFFAASAAKRAAAEAGLPRAASAREADDLLRDAATFLTVAERALGAEAELPLPLRPAS
jgi:hypothetical protein